MTPIHLTAAYGLDLAAGDPEWFPHPVRLFGALIRAGERRLLVVRRGPEWETFAGAALTAAIVGLAWSSGRSRHWISQVLLAWTTLATRSLLDEADSVIRALEAGNLTIARIRLSRIVGRDTANLDESEVARAVIETLAESACDGIVAPLFWLAAAGVPGAMAYKAANTLDSMIGHPEPPHQYFGRVAACLDDLANLLPARLTAIAISAAAGIHSLQGRQALRIWWRDGGRHASPNAGQSEAAMAGALGVRLGGANWYDGLLHEAPQLHSEGRQPNAHDARTARTLVATVSLLAFGVGLLCSFWSRRK